MHCSSLGLPLLGHLTGPCLNPHQTHALGRTRVSASSTSPQTSILTEAIRLAITSLRGIALALESALDRFEAAGRCSGVGATAIAGGVAEHWEEGW